MFYVHLNRDDVYLSKSEEPRETVMAECSNYREALNKLSLYQTYMEPQEPIDHYIYPEDCEEWYV